jgi:predicted membrane channel-forming protein YqfA (hemolysin III family)
LLLICGQVLPVVLLVLAPWLPRPAAALTISAALAAYLPKLTAVGQFRESLAGAVLHPLGVLVLMAIQWYAFVRNALGRPATWKGRPYPAQPAATAGP